MSNEELIKNLYLALKAQAFFSDIQRAGYVAIMPDDPRYTPLIGEWDGSQTPKSRIEELNQYRRNMRTKMIKAVEERKQDE